MGTRVEIQRDGLWRQLELSDKQSIKYNALINRIGKISKREISHTNTFSLPATHQNTEALGINIFNNLDLAIALNSKFEAKYYVEDKLLQKGFLIINNTSDGKINVNFIDETLELIEQWGSMNYYDLLTSDSLNTRPLDYQAAIAEMKDYNMDPFNILVPLSTVGTRGYNLSVFPNSLNAIGDEFQKDASGRVHLDNVFNPYQSRPIFNAKALFDLATETFGYTPIYDSSVDWSVIEKTFLVAEGLNETNEEENLQQTNFPSVGVNSSYSSEIGGLPNTFSTKVTFNYPSTLLTTLRPLDIPNWVDPEDFEYTSEVGYLYERCIFVPNIIQSTAGTVRFQCDLEPALDPAYFDIRGIWANSIEGGDVVFKNIVISGGDSTSLTLDKIIDKSSLFLPPTGGGDFIGIIAQVKTTEIEDIEDFIISNMRVTETYLPDGIVSYDEFGQFTSNTINLTYAAPRKTLKELLSGLMQKEGILMSVDSTAQPKPTIKFFSYGQYETQKNNGNYYDWSGYLRQYNSIIYNTDYGNEYGEKNFIGLKDPFKGNTYILSITNQGNGSKYKDTAENYVELFKDCSTVLSIENSLTPYFEYKNTGLGLVEGLTQGLGGLSQQSADNRVQGIFIGLKHINNVNYAVLPSGINEWYNLVDRAIRIKAKFMLPVEVVRTLDLSKPVFIEELGGFFIIEEISEYVNGQTLVEVKLIKLIDNLGESFTPSLEEGQMQGTIAGSSDYDGSTLSLIGGSEKSLIGSYSGSSDYDSSTLTSFSSVGFYLATDSGESIQDACIAGFRYELKYHDGAGEYPVQGDSVFLDAGLQVAYNGQDLFYKMNNNTSIQISGFGNVDQVGNCQ